MFVTSSASRHPFIAIILSIGSLIVVHGATIFAHEYIDHANPEQKILYKLDTGLENIEHAYAKLFGDMYLVKAYNHDLKERLTEIEELLHIYKTDVSVINKSSLEFLTRSATTNARASVKTLHNIASEGTNDLGFSTLAIATDSLLQELIRRYQKIATGMILVKNKELFKNAEMQITEVQESLKPLLESLQIDQKPEILIQKEIRYITMPSDTSADLLNADDNKNESENTIQCGAANTLCSTDRDCCTQDGLQCIQKLTTRGTTENRCFKAR